MPLQICFSAFKEAHRQIVSEPSPVRSICLEPELCLQSGFWASGHPGSKELTKSIWCAEREKCGNTKAYRSLGFISSWRKVKVETWMPDVSCIQPPTVELRSITHWMSLSPHFPIRLLSLGPPSTCDTSLYHLSIIWAYVLEMIHPSYFKNYSIQLCFNIILENIAWG